MSKGCWCTTLIITCVVLAVVLFVTLIAVSIKTIDNDQVGIKYNTVSRVLGTKVYQQGRYAVDPGEKFFLFLRRYVTLTDTNQICLSSDGLVITLDIAYQYKLSQDEQLVDFFLIYGSDYETVIRLLAWSAVRETCSNWPSDGFFYNRQDIETEMLTKMQANFAAINVGSGFFQLSDVELPDAFNTAISQTQESMQDADQATSERAGQLTNATSSMLQMEQDAQVLIIQAQANAEVITASANATAQSITAQLQSQADVYYQVMQSLNFGAEDLINYISLQTIENSANSVVGVDSPAYFSFRN